MSAKLEWLNGSTLRELACDVQAELVNCSCKCKLCCAFDLSACQITLAPSYLDYTSLA